MPSRHTKNKHPRPKIPAQTRRVNEASTPSNIKAYPLPPRTSSLANGDGNGNDDTEMYSFPYSNFSGSPNPDGRTGPHSNSRSQHQQQLLTSATTDPAPKSKSKSKRKGTSTERTASDPSDAALFWSFIGRLLQKRKEKAAAARKVRRSAPPPTTTFSPAKDKRSTATQQRRHTFSVWDEYKRQRHAKRVRATKAMISGPVQGGTAVVRTDSGREYGFPAPGLGSESESDRRLSGRGRGSTGAGAGVHAVKVGKGARGVIMPAQVREVQRHEVSVVPGERVVRESVRGEREGNRVTKWGDFMKSSEESERKVSDRETRQTVASDETFLCAGVPSPSSIKGSGANADAGIRCRICQEKTRENDAGLCAYCEYTQLLHEQRARADWRFAGRTEYLPSDEPTPPVPHLKDSRHYKSSKPKANLPNPFSPNPFADFDSDNTARPTTTYSQWQQRQLEAEYESFGDPYGNDDPAATDDRRTLLQQHRPTKRRVAVSSVSPVSPQTHHLPAAPPIPQDDEYTSRKYRRSRKGKKTSASSVSSEVKKEHRRSSFYNFWDDVLASSRTSLRATGRTYNAL
ncbi:hypothetical protein MMC16_007217 [Acarospora aff. strigata]|nr:hypothetical protein [Acarospora aff. strigata]